MDSHRDTGHLISPRHRGSTQQFRDEQFLKKYEIIVTSEIIWVDKTQLPYLESGQESRVLTLVFYFHFNKGYRVSHERQWLQNWLKAHFNSDFFWRYPPPFFSVYFQSFYSVSCISIHLSKQGFYLPWQALARSRIHREYRPVCFQVGC